MIELNPHPTPAGAVAVSRAVLAALVAVPLALGSPAQAQDAAAHAHGELGAYFTEQQAETGEMRFRTGCGGCHGLEMVDTFGTYPDVASYYLFISASMPADNPGGLPEEDYLDIVAWLLHARGFPAGEEELEFNRMKMAEIHPGDSTPPPVEGEAEQPATPQ